MDGGLRQGHLLVMTLLLGSLAWTLVIGQLPGRPTKVDIFKRLFIGRCEEYQHIIFPEVIEYVLFYTDFHISDFHNVIFGIVVKFEEISLQFGKVQKSSRYNKVRKSSRSTCNHDCYRKTLSILIL